MATAGRLRGRLYGMGGTVAGKQSPVELKPCPFCGAGACQPFQVNFSGSQRLWEIGCTVYCVSMRRRSRTDVVKDWNTRYKGDQ